MPILEGLDITARTAGNAVIEEALMKVRKSHGGGPHHRRSAAETGVFPNMVMQMIGVGEATGAMDAMLSKIADFYEDEVDAATKDLLTLMEPMMIGFLGVVGRRHRHLPVPAAVRHDRQTGRVGAELHPLQRCVRMAGCLAAFSARLHRPESVP